MKKEVLIEIKNLKKHFETAEGTLVQAVDGVSFSINKGETLGLVGESGCGKTTCGRTTMGLYSITDGDIYFKGQHINDVKGEARKKLRKEMQIIFQDPYASLNPRMTVGEIIAEGMDNFKMYDSKKRAEKVQELLSLVGLNKEHASRFPHEFSGGQRQRIGIARALAVEPEFIVCDEPISALDVSIQAQIVNLLIKLQKKFGLTYLFIAHDLSMVKHISDKVGVMYLGKLVEIGPSEEIFKNPKHPYTKALISAIPIPDPNYEKNKVSIKLEGELPSPINPPSGCRFRTRCSYVKDICITQEPELKEIGNDYKCACHLV